MSIHSEYDRNILVHYGVKGMKWGRHLRRNPEDEQSRSDGGGGGEESIFDEDEIAKRQAQEEEEKEEEERDREEEKKANEQEYISNVLNLLGNITGVFKNAENKNNKKPSLNEMMKNVANTATTAGKAAEIIRENNKGINRNVTNAVRSVQTIANKTRQMQKEENVKKYGKPIANAANSASKAAEKIRENNKGINRNVTNAVRSTQTIANRVKRDKTEKNVEKYGRPIADTATAIGKAAETIRDNRVDSIDYLRGLLNMLEQEQLRRRRAR